MREIELLPEFAEWWQGLPPDAREAIGHDMRLLAARGPMPRRRAIVLVGGDKSGDARFYDRMIARADGLFAEHLYRLGRDGGGSPERKRS